MGLSLPSFAQLDPGQIFQPAQDIIRGVEGAAGERYSITLRNMTNDIVNYNLNGEPQIGLLPHYQVTHRGGGSSAEIRFDNGTGTGVVYEYNLPSGRSYTFQRVPGKAEDAVGDIFDAQVLNLFSDQ
jgi:hypothetical protein